MRYLVLVPFVTVLIFGIYFRYFSIALDDSLFNEKLLEKRTQLQLITNTIEYVVGVHDNWEAYPYRLILIHELETIDRLPHTFGAVYDKDLNLLTERNEVDGYRFDPLHSEQNDENVLILTEGVLNNNSGTFVSKYMLDSGKYEDISLYFEWIPIDTDIETRYLTMVGVSRLAITNKYPGWIVNGAYAMFMLVVLMEILLVGLLSYLGYIYEKRDASKSNGAYRSVDKR